MHREKHELFRKIRKDEMGDVYKRQAKRRRREVDAGEQEKFREKKSGNNQEK